MLQLSAYCNAELTNKTPHSGGVSDRCLEELLDDSFQATALRYFVHFIVLSGFLDHLDAYTVTGLGDVYLPMLDLH